MEQLEQLVFHFAELDAEQKRLKKEGDPLKDKIKTIMNEHEMDRFEKGPIQVTFSIQERRTMNEERLLQKLKSLGLTEAIKTVEKPDQQVIEDLIYEGALDPSDLDECIERKQVEVLRVKGGEKLIDSGGIK